MRFPTVRYFRGESIEGDNVTEQLQELWAEVRRMRQAIPDETLRAAEVTPPREPVLPPGGEIDATKWEITAPPRSVLYSDPASDGILGEAIVAKGDGKVLNVYVRRGGDTEKKLHDPSLAIKGLPIPTAKK